MEHTQEETDKLIEEQVTFVAWLKEKDLYDSWETAYYMQRMFRVWKAVKEDYDTEVKTKS
jgi:hypothetical protein